MSAKSFQLRVPAHLVGRIEELMRRAGWDADHTAALEGAARKLLSGAVQEAELAGPELWLDSTAPVGAPETAMEIGEVAAAEPDEEWVRVWNRKRP